MSSYHDRATMTRGWTVARSSALRFYRASTFSSTRPIAPLAMYATIDRHCFVAVIG
jgi:hypothetical protein